MDFLVNEEVIHIPVDESGLFIKRAHELGLRSTRRFLESYGYKRGKRTGNVYMKESI